MWYYLTTTKDYLRTQRKVRSSPACRLYCRLWREIAYRNIFTDVCDPACPNRSPLRRRFVAEIAHRNIVSDVIDFTLPRPHPPNFGPCRPRLFYRNGRGLAVGRPFRQCCVLWLQASLPPGSS